MSYASQQFLIFDNTSDANYQNWASKISAAILAMGWIQQNDTGQGVFALTTLTFTQVTVGATAVYSYSGYTGPAPRVGMSIVITGFLTGGNNVTATLTAVSGGASGTVTVALTTQANETHAGTGVTTLSTSPASGVFTYEIWGPGDGATTFYLKVEYGSSSAGTKGVRFRMSLGTTTNGAGTLTGFLSVVMETLNTNLAGQGALTYDCYFSGDTNRLGMMLWRGLNMTMFCVERTKNTDGTDSADGVTIFADGVLNAPTQGGHHTIVFGVAAATASSTVSTAAKWATINPTNSQVAFNNNVPIAPVVPAYGKYGNPATTLCFVDTSSVAEACLFTTTLYGATRTYIATGNRSATASPASASYKIAMRYD